MTPKRRQLFLSYSGDDAFEASLLQVVLEFLLKDLDVRVWSYQRDQAKSERQIGRSLKLHVQESTAAIFLVSPSTVDVGAAQWMELAYADAFDVSSFVLLHRLTFQDLKSREKGVPPLLLESQCTPSSEWKVVIDQLRSHLENAVTAGA